MKLFLAALQQLVWIAIFLAFASAAAGVAFMILSVHMTGIDPTRALWMAIIGVIAGMVLSPCIVAIGLLRMEVDDDYRHRILSH